MQQPLQITFKDIPHSDAVEIHLREHVEKLEQFNQNIISCHIVIEQTQRSQSQGKLNNIHIKLTVPGRELVVTGNEDENLYISIRDAFSDMREQLLSHKQQIKGQIKSHAEVLHGTVVRIFEVDGFGFIKDTNGDEYYFNSGNLVKNSFEKILIGTEVSFIPAMGNDGLQARRVSVKHL